MRKIFFPALFLIIQPLLAGIIRPGMTLHIVVKDDEQLSQSVLVNDDGTIDYPMYQDVSVTDKTTSELQDILTYKLAKFVESPFVLVNAVESPLKVQVLGQVKTPGLVQVHPGSGIQEVLSTAGGPLEGADLSKIKVVPKNGTDEQAVYCDFKEFLTSGDLSLLPPIRNGDRVIVLGSIQSKLVKILGAVNKPGFYPLNEKASVFDMIYLAGGPEEDANLTKVRIMGERTGTQTDFLLNVQKYLDEGRADELPTVSEGDVIVLYQKTLTWTKTLQVVRDLVTLATAWLLISQVF